MAMFGAAWGAALRYAVRYFGSTAIPGKKK
jgi:hypothetical protein